MIIERDGHYVRLNLDDKTQLECSCGWWWNQSPNAVEDMRLFVIRYHLQGAA